MSQQFRSILYYETQISVLLDCIYEQCAVRDLMRESGRFVSILGVCEIHKNPLHEVS